MFQTQTRLSDFQINPATIRAVATHCNRTLISEYLEWKQTHAPVAAKRYRIWIERFQTKTNKAPEYLDLGDWNAFANDLDGRFAPKSIQFALNIVHNYLYFWHEKGRLQKFPLYLARVPKAIPQSHLAIKDEEYDKMIDHLKEKGRDRLRDLVIIRLLHDTGMRVGELVQLEIEQIEEDSSAIIQTEKTVNKRQVFWNRDTDEVLHNLIVERIGMKDDSEWLFVSRQSRQIGKAISTRSVQRIIERIRREVGIERKISPHSFRHAFIHRMAALSVPDAIIAQLVGHSTPHTVAHYTKLSRPEFRSFASRQFQEIPMVAT